MQPADNSVSDYRRWVAAFDTLDDSDRAAIRDQIARLANCPMISIVMPVYNTPEPYLRAAITSVRAQIYPYWELCIADDASPSPHVVTLLEQAATADRRIRWVRRATNGHISEATNTALTLASGEWVALMDHDDILPEHALYMLAREVTEHPDAQVIYSDEDRIDDNGLRSHPYFKPDFDPILLLGQNYFSHLCMMRRSLILQAGGFRVGYEGSQDWDVVLRVVEGLRPDQIVHVPHVLYHWRVHPGSTSSSLAAKPYAATAARRAVTDHLRRVGQEARVLPAGWTGFNRIRWDLSEAPPPVTIVILPRTGVRLTRCINSARARAAYPDVEIMVLDDGDRRPMLRAFMRDWRKTVTVVSDYRNVSDGALRNAAAGQASGEILCFLHDDVEAVSDGWLEEMVGLLLQPGIGAVGAKLLYPDETIHHAGIVMGIGGTAGYIHRRADRLDPGYGGRAMLSQSFSAVSWACMVVRREAFEAVGGFDEVNLSGAYVDVDFCLRLGEAGWRVAWTPNAEMTRYASPTEPRESEGENAIRFAREIRYLHTRWAPVLAVDPAYNPNLSLAHETVPLAWPPRASYR